MHLNFILQMKAFPQNKVSVYFNDKRIRLNTQLFAMESLMTIKVS